MKLIRYVEIENFKTFKENIRIDLGHPTVLIGPNNAGKTSVIQALALWNRGVKAWYDKKGKPRQKEKRERLSAGINRLNILEVPVSETRFYWNGTRVRKGNTPIEFIINVGIERKGISKDCRLIFTYRDNEVIYCKPCDDTVQDEELLKFASEIQFNLLYPMSGIMSGASLDTEETLLPDGRISLYLGQGQTAQVLRNICYKVLEQDLKNNSNEWGRVEKLIEKLFLVTLKKPTFNELNGSLSLIYSQKDVEKELDISMAGRGLQQILLILAYLFWHKSSVLLIDEPDAHLEILRQKQVYAILKEVAEENGCQVVIATHSEVILDDAVDSNLNLLINGESVNLATQQDMKSSLRSIGIEHYYKARVHPRILFVEGSTDIENLKTLAKKLEHPAIEVLTSRLNYYYSQDVSPEDTLDNRLDKVSGSYGDFKRHFYSLRHFVPEFKGIALFDSDEQQKQDVITDDLAVLYWRNYEIENYFLSPEVILSYVDARFEEESSLFKSNYLEKFERIIDTFLLSDVFSDDKELLKEYKMASKNLKRTILSKLKMSTFTEKVLKKFAEEEQQPILLNKGEYFQFIEFTDANDIPTEVNQKLDKIVEYLDLKENS